MNKIYTYFKTKIWESEFLATLSVFGVACLILVLSSFSTKEIGVNPNNSFQSDFTQVVEEQSPHFVVESVGEKHKILKAHFGEKTLIFRKERIELYEGSLDDNFNYFIFKNSPNRELPLGSKLISQEYVDIENASMANVLGTTKKLVSTYQELIYKNIYEGVDLVASIHENGVRLRAKATDDSKLQKFNLELFGFDVKNLKSKNELALNSRSNALQFRTEEGASLSYANNEVSFNYQKTNTQDITLDISFK